MSLTQREERALESINGYLTGTDPRLAGLLDTFSKLAAGEEMPTREAVRKVKWPQAHQRPLRASHPGLVRLHATRARQHRRALLVWIMLSAALITVAVAMSRGGSRTECILVRAVACASTASTQNPSLGAHEKPASHSPPG